MDDNYLSRNTSTCLKGWLALAILVHHIYQFSGILSGTSFSFILINLGYWAVGLFMFLSGYGLYESYKAKGQAYIQCFPQKRLLPFEAKYILYVALYCFADYCMGTEHTLKEYIQTFTYGSTIISFGWYLQLSLVTYLMFWVVFRFIGEEKKRSIVLGILLGCFIVINIIMGIDEGRYTPFVYFGVGLIWSVHQEKIDVVLKKAKYVLFLLSGVVFLGGYICLWKFTFPWYVVAAIRTISGIACIIVMQSWLYFIHQLSIQHKSKWSGLLLKVLENPAAKWLGTISLEVYVLQGLVLRVLYLHISNPYQFAMAGFACTIIFAFMFKMSMSVYKK